MNHMLFEEREKDRPVSSEVALKKKNQERQEIESLTALYLAQGGAIKRIATGETVQRLDKPH